MGGKKMNEFYQVFGHLLQRWAMFTLSPSFFKSTTDPQCVAASLVNLWDTIISFRTSQLQFSVLCYSCRWFRDKIPRASIIKFGEVYSLPMHACLVPHRQADTCTGCYPCGKLLEFIEQVRFWQQSPRTETQSQIKMYWIFCAQVS